jgi:hypothetical protein
MLDAPAKASPKSIEITGLKRDVRGTRRNVVRGIDELWMQKHTIAFAESKSS